MKVLMDVTALAGLTTGVGEFTRRIAEELANRTDVDLATVSFTWRGRSEIVERLPNGARHVRTPIPARLARTIWAHSKYPPIDLFAGRADVVYGPNYFVPPARCAAVASVHDLTFVLHPDLAHPATIPFARLIAVQADRGCWFHTAAKSIAEEIEAVFPAAKGRVTVVPDGVTPVPEADPNRGRALAGSDSYVLALGTIEPRKNFLTLVEAFEAVAGLVSDIVLVIAGPDGWDGGRLRDRAARSRFRDRIRLLGWVSDQDRACLMRGASVFAFPSLYEGFGLPPLEAMTAGVPVVASTAGALPEVLGDAAILVPPGDREKLAEAIFRLLEDERLANSLRSKGSARAARYTWERCAAGLVSLFATAIRP